MRLLLTGGAGYIGSHTALELAARGHSVVVADDLSNGHEEALRRVGELTSSRILLHRVDMTDAVASREVFQDHQFDAVLHFAGLKSVAESAAEPIRYYRTNLVSTLVLLELMREFQVNQLVFSSSATVYGDTSKLPVSEDDAGTTAPTSPYGRTKAVIEHILLDAAAAHRELEIAILRYFNPVGAHPSGRLGESPNTTPNNLLPIVGQVASGIRSHVTVFGNDYPTSDGTGVRDYIHVTDLARGHIAALENLRPGVQVFNLGTGSGRSVLEVIRAFARAADRDIPFRVEPRRPGDVAASYADVSRAREMLGWRATKTLDDACEDAWRWHVDNPHGYSTGARIEAVS